MIHRHHGSSPDRRAVMLGAAAFAAPAFATPVLAAAGGTLAFDIRRSGRVIGRHEVKVVRGAEETRASIEAEFAVKIGPLTVYRYRHTATEVWRGGRFASLSAVTVETGGKREVTAHPEGGGVRVAVNGRDQVLPGAACPLTHWNMAALQHPLFNAQTGAAMMESVTRQEGRSVVLADGRTVPAAEVTLTGSTGLTDWYDADGEWAGLRLKAPDGSVIEYRRL